MKFLKLFFLFLPILIAHSSLDGMERDIQKYKCENYLELLPPELYNQVLNFRSEGNPEIGFWIFKHKPPTLISTFDSGMKNVSCMAFDETNNRLIAGSKNGGLRSWKLEDKNCEHIFKKNKNTAADAVESLQIYKAKNQLLALLHKGSIAIWDLVTNNKIQKIESPHRNSYANISSMLLDEDNNRLFIGICNGPIRIHDLTTNQTINTFKAPHSDWVTCLAFDPKRKHLITGSSGDVGPTIWNLSNNTHTKTKNSPYRDTTHSLLIDSENNRLISLLYEGYLTILSLDTNSLTHKINVLVKITSFIFEKLYNRLILGLNFGSIDLFDLTTNTTICSFHSQKNGYTFPSKYPGNLAINSIIKNNTNNQLIAGLENGHIAIFDLCDPEMKKILDTTMLFNKHYALMKAYECWRNKNILDLSDDTLLHSGFTALPPALQQVIQYIARVKLTA